MARRFNLRKAVARLTFYGLRNSAGNFAIFAAIRRAS
jgi:hypothetical protein